MEESLENFGAATSNQYDFLNQTTASYFIRLKYKESLEWVALTSQSYASMIETVKKRYPELENQELVLSDSAGAVLSPDFFAIFLGFSERGVIIQVAVQKKTLQEIDRYPLPGPSTFSDSSSLCSFETNVSCLSDITNEEYPRKRARTELKEREVNVQELREFILKAPGGKEVVFFYRNNKTLDDKHRKRLVNIVVNHMVQDSFDVLPSNNTKATYASAIVQLFPALRDKTTEGGFEAFFDPVSKKGFLTTRIRTVTRGRKQPSSKPHAIDFEDITQQEEYENLKTLLKKADPNTQRNEIFERTHKTFKIRNTCRFNIFVDFPRFLDTDGLISYEFFLKTGKDEDIFLKKYPEFVEKIFGLYKSSVLKVNETLIKDSDYWDKETRCLFALLELLPPTAAGKKSNVRRETVSSALQKLLKFQHIQVPLKNILNEKPSTQPFILAVGTKESDISVFYVVFDDKILKAGENIIDSFDYLFKCHFVFDTKFYQALEQFFNFISFFFYDITPTEISSRARELKTKLLLMP